ncbi:type VII secretion protein EccC [Plantactinospora mayteni]|uniref:Type VII secretion protein EccC n=1 Tax=Plantactinospora mayteni TaxID=566021 RepID=A0ABQ4F0B1_9ACTN|nr:type VII secretion protein EccCa [Plantactinospora mayteni]GIH00342.1 type VII secretion protein EccC [Plantactinospora mayteni]
MGTLVRRRPARRLAPPYPQGEVVLEPVPEIPPPGGRSWSRLLIMLPMLAGAAAIALMFAGGGGSNPFRWLTGGLFGISMLGIVAVQFATFTTGASKQEMQQQRREYLFQLGQQRGSVRRVIRRQLAAEYYAHPDPDTLWSFVDSARLWERRYTEADFGQVRIGLGPRDLAATLAVPPPVPAEKAEPVSALALHRFVEAYRRVPELPMVLALGGFARVYLRGDQRRVRALVRALLAQAAVWHAPEDLVIAACAGRAARPQWEWAKWLPHTLHPTATDALGPVRLIAPTVVALEAMLESLVADRPRFDPTATEAQFDGAHLLVVIDGGDPAGSDHLLIDGGVEGATVLDLTSEPPRNLDRATIVLDVTADGELRATTYASQQPLGRADALSLVATEALALQLAPLRLAGAGGPDRAMNAEHGLAELLGLGDPYEYDAAVGWAPRPHRERLRVPIGIGPDGAKVELDLKESAQDGMGPHGLLIGATGSGKSELLRTLVLALAVTNSSETLNFVLVDFKGGATFASLDRLPHTSAVITNLADELPLVDRMTDAINGELIRRQELLRRAGNYVSQRDYERARAAGVPLAPLPTLLVVCDEFSELLSAKPDFIDMFVQIGRLGRSLGVHLLLASQRLEEGRLRGLDTHLSYRVGLRTFSPVESRTVLGVNDAYELPRAPGHGFLKFGTEPLVRFRAAYVSGAHRRAGTAEPATGDERIRIYTSGYVPVDDPADSEAEARRGEAGPDGQGSGDERRAQAGPDKGGAGDGRRADVEPDEPAGETLLEILTKRLTGRGVPAHQVWLPPLSTPPSLGELLDGGEPEPLRVAVGVVDRPFEQRRDPLWLNLSGAGGHVVVVGAPQSGKSSLLRTLIVSLALSHTPRDVQIYCLDFGGGVLASVRDLPHVGGVAARRDANQIRRTIAEVETVLAAREQLFTERGIDSVATLRRMRGAGELPEERFGDVFLVVDGWATIRDEFEDLAERIIALAGRGLSYGVHLVATAGRWLDLRSALRDSFGTRLELRLGDPSDSSVDRRAAANVPAQAPGRGITQSRHQFLAALPRLDGGSDVADLPAALNEVVVRVREGWSGDPAPRVRLLPPMVPYEVLPAATDGPGPAIGLAELDLGPVHLDLTADPHCFLIGDVECGKSAFLRMLARAVADRQPPKQARIIAVDYRRSLLGALPEEHLLGYGSSANQATELIRDAARALRERLPGSEITPERLRARDWWTGPDLYVLVDDYDLVAGDRNPLAVLHELLPQSREIGLHVVVARRSGGASRAFYDPVLARLRDLGSPAILMSCDPLEGPLISGVRRPGPLPAGRGWLSTRREGARLVQFGWVDVD